jgi:ADP-ribose pyrophosphatase YjhB (NUDIX family)
MTTTDDPDVRRRLASAGWSGKGEPPPVTRLAAYGVIRRDGRLLLCRVAPGNLGEGRWTLPGGGLEFGEPPEGGAIREVAEETGLDARIDGPPRIFSDTGTWPLEVGDVPYHHVRFVYPMTVVGGVEQLEVDGSTDAFGWHASQELAELRRADRLGDLVVRILEAEPWSE